MSYALLDKLRLSSFPAHIEGDDVQTVRAYLAAGLVNAEITEGMRGRSPVAAKAKVLGITPSGRKAMESRAAKRELANFIARK